MQNNFLRRSALILVIGLGPVSAVDAVDEEPAADSATESSNGEGGVAAESESEREPIPVDDIRILVEVFHKIRKDYVEEIDDKDLIEDAMRGMLAGLDPHSAYLDEDHYRDLQEGTSGEFGGLGIEVGMEDGFVEVIAPIDDTPAQKAGILAGDIIVRIDEAPVKGMSLGDAVEKMRGKVGTKIKLTVLRDGSEKPLTFTLVRDLIKVRSVRSRIIEPGYGYLRVSQFQGPTGKEVRKQLRDLKTAAGGALDGLILDLRNNPGGVLGGAVSVSDTFLESGLIVYTNGRIKDSELEFTAKPPDLLEGAPLIVLINEGSASASEIVAGALQDSGRALIMGRQSFGKGSVQTILPMNNKTALKLTTARYFTPSGRSIQAEGIKPDIVIEKLKLAARQSDTDAVKESHLEGHLINPDEADATAVKARSDEEEKDALAKSDYELYEALNMLKGMKLLRARSKITP